MEKIPNSMYQDEIYDIECAIKLSLLYQHEKGKSLSGAAHQKQIICDVCDKTMKRMDYHPTHLPNGTPVCCGIIWNQIVCPTHLHDGTHVCCGCMRLKTSNIVTFINLGDDRVICPDCYSTAIFDIKQCEPLIRNCHEFFDTLDMKIGEDIPVFLVDTMEMMTRLTYNETEPANSTEPLHPDSLNFGVTLEHDGPVTSVTSCSRKGDSIIMAQQPQYGSGLRIAILFGLPRIMTGAILAHEMMHAWFHLKGVGGDELEAKVAEGMSQVMSRKWLESNDHEIETLSPPSSKTTTEEAQFQKSLIETYKYMIDMHSSYCYGEGFRDAQRAVSKFGLQTTLNHILTHKTLPKR